MAKRHLLAFQFKRTVLTDFTNAVNAIYLILGFQEVFQKKNKFGTLLSLERGWHLSLHLTAEC